MKARLLVCALLVCALPVVLAVAQVPVSAAELKPETLQAFDQYVRAAEDDMDRDLQAGVFLASDALPSERRAVTEGQLRGGAILVHSMAGAKPTKIPGGLIHDWAGTAFIPGATLEQTLALAQDYDHLADYYQPEVVRSRLLRRDGDHFSIFMRLRKKKIVTVLLDTEYDVRYFRLDSNRAYSRSYSTRIRELENPGQANERELPEGQDHGFLWRLDSYWRFREADGGVYVECRAISLTRDVPAGLNWLVEPFVQSIPQESLRFTLESTRQAVTIRSTDALRIAVHKP